MALALRNLDLDSAYGEAEAGYVQGNPRSGSNLEANAKVMPGGNTRTVLHFAPYPLTLVRGEGCYVWDADGHRYIDFLGEYTAGLYGHSHPVIVAAIRKALEDGIVLGGPNVYEGRLAAELTARIPSLDLVRFCNSGTEANLYAVSTACAVTGRSSIMVFDGAYHGGVFYYAHGGTPLNAPFPTVLAQYNDLEGTRALIRQHASELAAVLIEPMMGAGGCIQADVTFLQMLREETKKVGVILIFDEVMTSRLSSGGLQKIVGVIPDMTSLGKYLGGGLTFGAFGGRKEIMSRFDPRSANAFPHAGTFNNNVLTMAAGYAGLSQAYTAEAAVVLNRAGDETRERLQALAAKHDVPVQFLGRGSMTNLHVTRTPIRSPHDLETASKRAGDIIHLDLLARGIYIARRGFIILSLPMEPADLDALVAAMDGVLEDRAALLRAAV
ncbi:MAG: aminotransferase class III-fold pyridoxal phosphate-dependent enzyme [Alphaproteobacteria bacterium]|nr:aminotransferase class III-fold pyridoxal phosphate-dependent enzyme [Alphaproteobacteria bacterium]